MSSCSVINDSIAQHLEPSDMDDNLLVQCAQAGHEWAFVELCTRNSKRVFNTIYGVTKNREDAEDALQEMAVGQVRVAGSRCHLRLSSRYRFATDTAAFAGAHFPQDQQIKSNFNQAHADPPALFLSCYRMSAHECHSVSQITVS